MSFQIDWSMITSRAYQTLLENKITDFPIDVEKITLENVKIISYQKYAQITKRPIIDILNEWGLSDAFLVRNIRPNLHLIMYDSNKYPRRVKHSLLHEIGHLICCHNKHGDREEIEAHFFASQINAPNVLIKELYTRGYEVSIDSLMDKFGLSHSSSEKKMKYLEQYSFSHKNEYDDIITSLFKPFLDTAFPNKSKQRFDDYFDEKERDREQWQ